VHLRGSGHGMLRRAGVWDDLTADFVLHTGLAVPASARLAEAIEAGDSVM